MAQEASEPANGGKFDHIRDGFAQYAGFSDNEKEQILNRNWLPEEYYYIGWSFAKGGMVAAAEYIRKAL